MRKNIRKTNYAVSEIIGTVLLLGITISMFSLLSFVVLSYPSKPPTPSVNLIGYVDVVENNVTLEHYGGESLENTTVIIIRIQGTSIKLNFSECLIDENKNNIWDVGEQVVYNNETINGQQIEFIVVDTRSNSIITSGVLQEEGV